MSVDARANAVPPDADAASSAGIVKATAIVALGNVSSRVLGLLRESILASLFGGATANMDAFRIAIIIPRSIYDLLVGGHINSALVPVLSDYAEHQDSQSLWDLLSALLSVAFIVTATLLLLLEFSAPQLIQLIASDESSPQVLAKSTELLRITAPALFFLSVSSIASSLLYALRRFTLPAFAATVFNLSIVVVTVALAGRIGIEAAALGWLAGAIVQFLTQWFGLRGLRMRFRFLLRHPGLRTVAVLYTPVMFSLALDVLINRPFSYNLASRTGAGNVSIMEYATTLVQFPHGLVATAISIAVLPTLVRQVEQPQAFKDTLGQGLRLALALIIPATIGLMVLAPVVVALIFEHGEFTASDTVMTARALRLYMLGLPFASIDLLLIFAFYARQDTLTPALVGLLSLLCYIITAALLLPRYSFFALMIADSVKHMVHASVSGWLLRRHVPWMRGQQLLQTAGRALVAAALMGLLAGGILFLTQRLLPQRSFPNEVLQVALAGGISGIFYLLLAQWFGIGELQVFFAKLRQKYNR